MNADIFNEEAKQLQYAITESLKNVQKSVENDVGPPLQERCIQNGSNNDLNINCCVNDAIGPPLQKRCKLSTGQQGSIEDHIYVNSNGRRKKSSDEQKMETEGDYANDALEQMSKNCTVVSCNMKINNVCCIAIDANHNNNDGLVIRIRFLLWNNNPINIFSFVCLI